MFKSVILHWLGAFKCLILTTNERVGWLLHWLEAFKCLKQYYCFAQWGSQIVRTQKKVLPPKNKRKSSQHRIFNFSL